MFSRKKKIKKKSKVLTEDEEIVKKANDQNNPLGHLVAFHSFSRNGLDVALKCCKASQLDKITIDQLFELLKKNMKQMYEESAWGWNEKDKFFEMTENSAWYLIASTKEGKTIAFSHFRFDMDYGLPVLYCYELQLELECRHKGLGRFMLQVLELMAFSANLRKVVLTVFVHNLNAVGFFKSHGYVVDETSPASTLEEQFDYEILSKSNKRISKS
ncbi:N-alpha-acetyltransferase 40 [Daphnia magna]|uniref:N-alpha-acetyltransferase 40 n=1 Tax=Daphnia magna TaxID=35525 RepID=A0A0P5ZK36_9CRUS|nr:N-alpha-acetyltransferase 40 [Daphnia magna]CAG4639724.1 EOG090X0MNC [Daphnia magna]